MGTLLKNPFSICHNSLLLIITGHIFRPPALSFGQETEYWTSAAPRSNILSPAHNFGLVTNICPVIINNKPYSCRAPEVNNTMGLVKLQIAAPGLVWKIIFLTKSFSFYKEVSFGAIYGGKTWLELGQKFFFKFSRGFYLSKAR